MTKTVLEAFFSDKDNGIKQEWLKEDVTHLIPIAKCLLESPNANLWDYCA